MNKYKLNKCDLKGKKLASAPVEVAVNQRACWAESTATMGVSIVAVGVVHSDSGRSMNP